MQRTGRLQSTLQSALFIDKEHLQILGERRGHSGRGGMCKRGICDTKPVIYLKRSKQPRAKVTTERLSKLETRARQSIGDISDFCKVVNISD